MRRVGEFTEACVCPYCFIYNEKGYVERAGQRGPSLYRTFDTRRRLANHLRKQHPDSFTLATIKKVA